MMNILRFLLMACSISFALPQTGLAQGSFSQAVPPLHLPLKTDRRFVFSNRIAGFFNGHSLCTNRSSFEGWILNEQHLLLDYDLLTADQTLSRSRAQTIILEPNRLQRSFASNISEELFMPDSLDALIVSWKRLPSATPVRLLFTDTVLTVESGIPAVHLKRGEQELQIYVQAKEHGCQRLWLVANGSVKQAQINEVFYKQLRQKTKAVNAPIPFRSSNPTLQQAALWSASSLNGLVTRQRGAGLWAGLPWFNNYWGRDTFISFHGALLITGHFKQAREILSNFARFQLHDSASRNDGRIPNRITNREVIYNTADGTWWFIRALYDYVLYTGDLDLLRKLYPAVRYAITAAQAQRVDANGYLTHGAAETWMDAQGADGAWSSRANRAVEIQALWYTALQIGARMASFLQEDSERARHWLEQAEQLRQRFNGDFWDAERNRLFDRLTMGGRPDTTLRPNQIFAVTVPHLPGLAPLLNEERARAVTQAVFTQLTLPQGVLSLSFEDANFHPFHHFQPYYVPDAAYHNGLIWTWLAGPVCSALAAFNHSTEISRILTEESRQILTEDAVGSFSELLEPVRRPGKSKRLVSGTVSQAWSLAEYRRNLIEDVLGYRPNAPQNEITFRPQLNSELKDIHTRVPYQSGWLEVSCSNTGDSLVFAVQSLVTQPLKVRILLPGTTTQSFTLPAHASHKKAFKWKSTTGFWPFASIDFTRTFPVLAHLPYKLLDGTQVVFPRQIAGTPVRRQMDVAGDDTGSNGRYVYPQNPAFKVGILDLRSVDLYDLGKDWGLVIHLQNLNDPGWHPEYGFQLTFVAVAVRDDSLPGPFERKVGRNANYQLSEERAFNRVVYIGGGIDISDGRGKSLARYLPAEMGFPIGYVRSKEIRFKIPKALIPGMSKATITVLCGAQDDHGGAGIGNFRALQKEAGEWHGGGLDSTASRVYDVLAF